MLGRIGWIISCTALCACLGESGMTDEEDSPVATSTVCQNGNGR